MSIRTFICVPLSDSVIDKIARISEVVNRHALDLSLKRGFKLVKSDNLHITLKFLGDIELEDIPRISDAMEKAVSGIEPFEVTVRGFGGLPRIEKPRILYVGVEDEPEHISEIAGALERGLPDVRKEHKKYIPHITFMRLKDPSIWRRIVKCFEGLWGEYFGIEQITCIDLMESELKPSGPQYRRLERVEFA